MQTHLQAAEKTANGTKYRIAFCGITDMLSPNGVLIVDPKESKITRFMCEKCVKVMNKKQ
jgi:hypothetical protein